MVKVNFIIAGGQFVAQPAVTQDYTNQTTHQQFTIWAVFNDIFNGPIIGGSY